MRFGENSVYVENISIYMNFGGYGRTYMVHRTFFVYYSKRAWPILRSNSTSFWFKTTFPRMNNKKNYEKRALGGPAPISLRSEYSTYETESK